MSSCSLIVAASGISWSLSHRQDGRFRGQAAAQRLGALLAG
jgi:hypothetical protein